MWAEHGPRGTVADEPPRAALSNDQQQRRRRTGGEPPKAIQQAAAHSGARVARLSARHPARSSSVGATSANEVMSASSERGAMPGPDTTNGTRITWSYTCTRHAPRITMQHAACNAYTTSGTWMYDVM